MKKMMKHIYSPIAIVDFHPSQSLWINLGSFKEISHSWITFPMEIPGSLNSKNTSATILFEGNPQLDAGNPQLDVFNSTLKILFWANFSRTKRKKRINESTFCRSERFIFFPQPMGSMRHFGTQHRFFGSWNFQTVTHRIHRICIFIYIHLPYKSTIHVGKYTSATDPTGCLEMFGSAQLVWKVIVLPFWSLEPKKMFHQKILVDFWNPGWG